MNVSSFYSSNKYLLLPTTNKPKVALAVDTSVQAENAFKLYNPFSVRAKYLKSLSNFLFLKINGIAKAIGTKKRVEKGVFIQYLEKKLNIQLVSSVYFATANDKVVLQLQSNSKIIGYLKFPLNKLGVKHINNEIKAIKILSEKNIVAPALLIDSYKNTPYLFLKELQGEIKEVADDTLNILLQQLKKQQKFPLTQHPRIIQLKEVLHKLNFQNELNVLEKVCATSKKEYFDVYEHGDFAPWNLISNELRVVPFDFEYFEEVGLEYMDLIKYYYQVGILLNSLTKNELLAFINDKIKIPEIDILIKIYLIKEIVRKTEENEPYDFEKIMLNILE